MLTEETTKKINNVIADKLGVSVDKIVPDAQFVEDLGADSLDQFEMVMAIEDEFNISIADEDAEKLLRVSDVYTYMEKVPGV